MHYTHFRCHKKFFTTVLRSIFTVVSFFALGIAQVIKEMLYHAQLSLEWEGFFRTRNSEANANIVNGLLVFHVESIFQWNSFPLCRYIMRWKFTGLINFCSLVSHILCAVFEHCSHRHYCDRRMQCLHGCRASTTKSPNRYLLKNIKPKLHWFIRRKKPFVSSLEIFWIADSWQFQVHLENPNCFIGKFMFVDGKKIMEFIQWQMQTFCSFNWLAIAG